jgi:peroxiredoxin Q/BCP
MALLEGTKAPDFTLKSTTGSLFSLHKDQLGSRCILYFYPKDFTPGCEKEACDFRDQFFHFEELRVAIYGISRDSYETHLKFREKFVLPFHLLSDPDGKVSKKYDASVPLLKISKRITYFIDEDLKIAAVYDNFFGAHLHMKRVLERINR